jgi:hypothetical protein
MWSRSSSRRRMTLTPIADSSSTQDQKDPLVLHVEWIVDSSNII